MSNQSQDGREVDLLHYIYRRDDLKLLVNNPANVLNAINEYSTTYNGLINVGPKKGEFITTLIQKHKPSIMLELGGYVGYSAILFGDAMRAHGGKYVSFEINPELAAVANQLVELAGLRDVVRIIVGSSNDLLRELAGPQNELGVLPMVFIDHWQKLYLGDMWLMEELGAVGTGSVIVADNVIFPGTPEYLRWMQASTAEKKNLAVEMKGQMEGEGRSDAGLIYETSIDEFDTQFGRDGVAVTMVIGR